MKITSLNIDRFGVWSGLNLGQLSPGLNVFYGANEAGKTTLMQFVRGILYGFDGERCRFVQPNKYSQSLGGGSMSVLCPNGEFHIQRHAEPISNVLMNSATDRFNPNFLQVGNLKETLELTSIDGKKQGDHLLRMIVSGVDEATFNNIFAIGLDEIQKLATLSNTEAGDMLFRLSIGLDRVSLVEVIKELVQTRNKIIDAEDKVGDGHFGELQKMLQQRAKLHDEMQQPKTQLREYCRLLNEQRQLDRIMAQLQEQQNARGRQERIFETAIRLMPIWDRRNDLELKIGDMGNVIPIEDDGILSLEAILEELAKKQKHKETLKAQLKAVKQKANALMIDERLWQLTPRIEVLLEEEPRIVELDAQISKLQNESAELEAALYSEEQLIRSSKRAVRVQSAETQQPVKLETHAAVRGAKIQQRPLDETFNEFQGKGIENFRVYAQQIRRCRSRLSRINEQYGTLKERTKILSEKIKGELAKRDVAELPEAMERTSEAVSHLKRGQAVSQRLGEMSQFRKELDRQNSFLIENQAIPPLMIVAFGAAFVIGCILCALWPIFGIPVFAVFGAPFLIGAVVTPFVMQKNSARKLEHNQRQLSILITQIEHARQEISAIDARFPGQGKTIETRFQEAQTELSALEKLMPIDAQRREATHQLKAIEERRNEAKAALEKASHNWNDWLKAAALPADWTPQQVRDLLDRVDEAGQKRRELEFLYDSLNQRLRDLHILTERIDRMLTEIGMKFGDGVSYIDILGAIRKKVKANEDAMEQLDSLKKERKTLLVQWEKLHKSFMKSVKIRDRHLGSFGAETAENLYALHERYNAFLKLRENLDSVNRELTAGIGGLFKDDVLNEMLELPQRNDLQNLLALERKEIAALKAQLRIEAESHGKLSVQLAELAADKTAFVKKRQLAILEESIRQAIKKWQIYAVSTKLLETIRKAYEKERQPQTLAEASDILSRLTQGRYRRVWTPLGEDTLCIDDHAGDTLDLNWFSRGTREQLFVALRLALTTTFAQHGSALPLILDDVLVNYDTRRAMAAARVLKEVAESGRQIFLFTCHEHICRIFQNLDVPVQILPSFSDENKQVRVLLPKSVLRERRLMANVFEENMLEDDDELGYKE